MLTFYLFGMAINSHKNEIIIFISEIKMETLTPDYLRSYNGTELNLEKKKFII